MTYSIDHKNLKAWFLDSKRDLPWRENASSYAVWVSEVMLQQTQVGVVIPYFEKWMKKFPTVESLATAKLDDVIKLWEGLGYYSRARNLHCGAKQVVEMFGGNLPSDPKELAKIKGIGPYTIGAIRSFAFKEKAAAVDGNVIRVLSRYFALRDDISKPKTVKDLHVIAEEILPAREPWITSEALIELGATVCQKKPKCGACPIRSSCLGFTQGIAKELPVKTKKIKITSLYRMVAVIQCDDHLLLKRGQEGKIMHDLHEFPYFENDRMDATLKRWDVKVESRVPLPKVSHSFTRYRVHLTPYLFTCREMKNVANLKWISMKELKKMAFSSGHRRILSGLK